MKVYACQLDIAWEDKAENFRRVARLLEATPPERDSLVVLPEMFSSGFSMNVGKIHESTPSESGRFVSGLARRYAAFLVAGEVVIGPDGRGRNQSVIYSPEGREIARYSKMQPFSLGGESDHYTPGREIVTFDCGGFICAPFICYDLRFPELFRMAALRGAQLFVVIANWPEKRVAHWITLLQARAIENLAYVVGVNRAGRDPNFSYPGRSLIVNPHGQILADAGEPERVVSAEVDPQMVLAWRKDFPALEDMRRFRLALQSAT
ncbi:MAG TPA: carbon-nitrogen family hydrolase [Methylomirabilota bacterium]|nr:carbon-nitrogen family hydrolase [Methylomirabilota bacterium]